jgi:hypothetical protein
MRPHRATVSQPWEQADDPALAYASDQLSWYLRSKNRSRRTHQVGELLILLSTASTLVVSALRAPAAVTASLAAVAVFLTGLRQVFDPNDRWVSSSVAWLALQQEVVRYHLLPEAERDVAARRALLDRTMEIVSAENQDWAARRRTYHPTPAAVVEPKAPNR